MNRQIMLEVVRINNDHSYMDAFPRWRALFEEIREKYDIFCDTVQQVE